jgi:hypothetical protein
MHARFVSHQRGSAAFEVLLLIPFILLIWMLLANMTYSGIRHIQTGAAMNLSAFRYVAGLTTTDREAARKAAEALVNDGIFPSQNNPASLAVSGQAAQGDGEFKQGFEDKLPEQDRGALGGLFAGIASRQTVDLSVQRTPPYVDLFPRVPLRDRLIVAANTWTYCEMKDEDFDGGGQLGTLNLIGGYVLWIFGGCGGDTRGRCEDRCG